MAWVAEATLRGIGEPPRPAIDEIIEIADDQRRERPRNCVLIDRRSDSASCLGTRIKAEWCLDRPARYQWVEHEGGFIPTVLVGRLYIAEPQRVTSTAVWGLVHGA
jgi:hypothetical protein